VRARRTFAGLLFYTRLAHQTPDDGAEATRRWLDTVSYPDRTTRDITPDRTDYGVRPTGRQGL